MSTFAINGVLDVDLEHPYRFHFFGFNSTGNIIYAAKVYYNRTNRTSAVVMYRICIFSQSISKIALIDLPDVYPSFAFDDVTEEICGLFKVVNFWDPNEQPLTLFIFNAKTGSLKWYYKKLSFSVRSLLNISKGVLFVGDLSFSTVIYAITELDEINATFDLRPVGNLPPCTMSDGSLIPALDVYLKIVEDGAIRERYDEPGHIQYCKFNGQWVDETFSLSTPTGQPFELLHSYYDGGRFKLEFGQTNSVIVFRVLKVKGRQPWEIAYTGRIPNVKRRNEYDQLQHYKHLYHCFQSDSPRMVFLVNDSSTLVFTILQYGQPCSLVETCIGVLWPHMGRLNPKLTDHAICRNLQLSKVVDVDRYFGNVY